jgi:hypothetical protein
MTRFCEMESASSICLAPKPEPNSPYWPGIDQDIEAVVVTARTACTPKVTRSVPQCLFQKIAVDFASHGEKQSLILVDCKTDWPEMGKNTNAMKLISTLRDHFCCTAAHLHHSGKCLPKKLRHLPLEQEASQTT